MLNGIEPQYWTLVLGLGIRPQYCSPLGSNSSRAQFKSHPVSTGSGAKSGRPKTGHRRLATGVHFNACRSSHRISSGLVSFPWKFREWAHWHSLATLQPRGAHFNCPAKWLLVECHLRISVGGDRDRFWALALRKQFVRAKLLRLSDPLVWQRLSSPIECALADQTRRLVSQQWANSHASSGSGGHSWLFLSGWPVSF